MQGHHYFSELNSAATAHGSGLKFLFKKNTELEFDLTQISFGRFSPGDACEVHTRATIDECFFIIKGRSEYTVGDEKIELLKNTLLIIPVRTSHSLLAKGQESLEFV